MTASGMPTFDRSPAALVDRFAVLAERIPDGTRRSMFGYPAVTIDGHLCFSLHGAQAILRLPESDREAFAAEHELRIFEPMPGRPMRDYVVLPDDLLSDDEAVGAWIDRSAAFVRSLPPKPAKRR